MNLIFVSHRYGKARSLALNQRRITMFAGLLLAVICAAFAAGYRWGVPPDNSVRQQAFLQAWQQELQTKRSEIESIKEDAREQLKALHIRMAELHARVLRLDALGEHLISTADIDAREFDFSAMPPVGGLAEEESTQAYAPPDFLRAVEALAQGIELREQNLSVLNRVLGNQDFESDRYLSGRPIKKGWLSSYYGRRNDPFTGKLSWHHGLDFAGREGSEIIAVAAGVVTWSGERYGYGKLVELNHGGGYVTRYAHAKKLLVEVGDVVDKGQTVALMGSSGRSTGPHVHFEVLRAGKSVNPLRYVKRKEKAFL